MKSRSSKQKSNKLKTNIQNEIQRDWKKAQWISNESQRKAIRINESQGKSKIQLKVNEN